MIANDATYTGLIEAAKARGAKDGRNAAEWFVMDVFGGRSGRSDEQDRETARTILQGIEDSDPLYLQNLPWLDLSGQWADVPSGPEVYADICSDVDVDPDEGQRRLVSPRCI